MHAEPRVPRARRLRSSQLSWAVFAAVIVAAAFGAQAASGLWTHLGVADRAHPFAAASFADAASLPRTAAPRTTLPVTFVVTSHDGAAGPMAWRVVATGQHQGARTGTLVLRPGGSATVHTALHLTRARGLRRIEVLFPGRSDLDLAFTVRVTP